jgi:hypothetical protein
VPNSPQHEQHGQAPTPRATPSDCRPPSLPTRPPRLIAAHRRLLRLPNATPQKVALSLRLMYAREANLLPI